MINAFPRRNLHFSFASRSPIMLYLAGSQKDVNVISMTPSYHLAKVFSHFGSALVSALAGLDVHNLPHGGRLFGDSGNKPITGLYELK